MSKLEKVKDLLPPIIQEISDLVGFPATEKLINKMGGLQLQIGKNLNKMDELRAKLLIESVGKANALLISKQFGGEIIYIPRCLKALRELRNQSFLRDLDNLKICGYSTAKSLAELCPRYGISDRFAWELLKEQKQSFQQELF